MNTHPNSYHDTSGATRPERRAYESAARTQEDRIADYLRRNPTLAATPSELAAKLFDESTPLTSVRRAVTNLTARDVLERTTTQRPGLYGRREYTWRYRGEAEPQGRLFG